MSKYEMRDFYEANRFYMESHWQTISVEVEPSEATYHSASYRRIDEWCFRNARAEYMIQPAQFRGHGRFMVRFFYNKDPTAARQDAVRFRLWFQP